MSDEPKDERGPAIAIVGGPTAGYKFYGPFPTVDAAVEELSRLAVPLNTTIDILRPASELPFRSPSEER